MSPSETRPRRRLGCLVAVLAALILLTAWVQLRVLRKIPRGIVVRPQPEATITIPASILRVAPFAAAAWPGYEPLSRPLLIAFSRGGSYMIGAKVVPKGFHSLPTPRGPVLITGRTFRPAFTYVQAFDLDGSTVSALRIDEPINAFRTTGYFLHERFHTLQSEKLFKEVPAEFRLAEDPHDVALAAFESRRLADWLRTGDPEAMRDFAALRARRRALFPAATGELREERVEGTAKFIQDAADQATWAPASVTRVLTRDLIGRERFSDMAKWRNYAVGATLCRWLDSEKVPGWRAKVENGLAPSEIVLKRLALGAAEIDRRVAAFLVLPAYAEVAQAARRDVAAYRAEREWQLAEYNGFPGWKLVLIGSASAGGFSGNWMDFPDHSFLLSAAEWSADATGFRVRLHDKYILGKEGQKEFALPPETTFVLDQKAWKPTEGKAAFHRLRISAPPRVDLSAEDGRLEQTGTHIRLELDRKPDGSLPAQSR